MTLSACQRRPVRFAPRRELLGQRPHSTRQACKRRRLNLNFSQKFAGGAAIIGDDVPVRRADCPGLAQQGQQTPPFVRRLAGQLVRRIVADVTDGAGRVSMETVKIVKALPALNEIVKATIVARPAPACRPRRR